MDSQRGEGDWFARLLRIEPGSNSNVLYQAYVPTSLNGRRQEVCFDCPQTLFLLPNIDFLVLAFSPNRGVYCDELHRR